MVVVSKSQHLHIATGVPQGSALGSQPACHTFLTGWSTTTFNSTWQRQNCLWSWQIQHFIITTSSFS